MFSEHKVWPFMLKSSELSTYIKNVSGEITTLDLCTNIPALINNNSSSWLGSLSKFHVAYAIHEMKKCKDQLSKRMYVGIMIFLKMLRFVAKTAQIDKTIFFNHHLVSTSIYDLSHVDVPSLIQQVRDKHPHYSLVIRSLDTFSHQHFIDKLKKNGFTFISFRKVLYLSDKNKLSKNSLRNIKRDCLQLNKHHYTIKHSQQLTSYEIDRVIKLYNMLYIEKHIDINPQYTSDFFHHLCHDSHFGFMLLMKNNNIDAFAVYEIRNTKLSAPCIGYDTALNTIPLYRMIVGSLIGFAKEKQLIFNMSAGATEFKMRRGAESHTEYYAVYTHHLTTIKKYSWKIFSYFINHVWLKIIKNIF